MTTAHDYFLTLRATRDEICLRLGLEASQMSPETRRLANANLAALAAVVKLLIDEGVVTDNELQVALNQAARGTDGSLWLDADTPPGGGTFNDWVRETFELGTDGEDVTAANTVFAGGQVGDSLLPSHGTITFDAAVHYAGNKAAKTYTSGGWSRALRTPTYVPADEVYGQFYFRAAAPPATSGCRIFAYQFDPASGTDIEAGAWALEVAVDSAGLPTMVDNGTTRGPGSTPPNICDDTWWRVEVGLYGATCECRLFGGALLQSTTASFSWTGAYSGGSANAAVVGQPRSALTSAQTWTTWHDDVAFATTGYPPPF